MDAKAILADERDLYMNSPIEYPFAEKIKVSELSRLKSFLISIFAIGPEDEEAGVGDAIRHATHEEIINTYLENHFSFDPEWYGVRELPKGVDGRPISALDDRERRRRLGFSS